MELPHDSPYTGSVVKSLEPSEKCEEEKPTSCTFKNLFFTSEFESGEWWLRKETCVYSCQSCRIRAGNGRFSKVGKSSFEIATQPDAEHTEFQNGNKSWFFFSVQGGKPGEKITMKVGPFILSKFCVCFDLLNRSCSLLSGDGNE